MANFLSMFQHFLGAPVWGRDPWAGVGSCHCSDPIDPGISYRAGNRRTAFRRNDCRGRGELMPSLLRLIARQLLRHLHRLGFVDVRQRGSQNSSDRSRYYPR